MIVLESKLSLKFVIFFYVWLMGDICNGYNLVCVYKYVN